VAVFIFDNDALDKMALIEGERWKKHQLDKDYPCFLTFKEIWYEFFQSAKNRNIVSKEADMQQAYPVNQGITDKNNNGAIYGDGGWTRYTVRLSGEILFIKDFSPSADITQKAQVVGFNLF